MIPRPNVTLDRSWRFPHPRVTSLSNGLQIWAFHLPGQHVVSADLVLDCALNREPRELEGIATLALRTSDEGTRSHPGASLAELLEGQGAQVDAHQTQRTAQLTLDVPASRLERALQAFAEIAQEPSFAVEDVAHHQTQLRAEYAQNRVNPRAMTALGIRRALYLSPDRHTRPSAGTPQTLARITPEGVRDFQRAHWGPHGAVLVLAGELPSNINSLVAEHFGNWMGATQPPPQPPLVNPGRRVLVLDRPAAVQADVTIAQLTIPRGDARLPALRMAGQLLAGAFTSRLNMVLREDLGYTYGVSGGVSPGRDQSTLGVSASFRTEVAADAIFTALDLLSVAEPFSGSELEAAKDYLLGVRPLATETASDITDAAARLAAGGVDVDYLHAQDAATQALRPDEVTDAYRSLIDPHAFSIAIAGKAEALVPQLAAQGLPVEVIEY